MRRDGQSERKLFFFCALLKNLNHQNLSYQKPEVPEIEGEGAENLDYSGQQDNVLKVPARKNTNKFTGVCVCVV